MSREHIYVLHVPRVWDILGGEDYDPWRTGKLPECKGELQKEYSTSFDEWTAKQHQQRINHLKAHEKELIQPISIDFVFHRIGGAEMVIEDGNHRFFAHVQLGKPTILSYFGGFVDVLEYLTGITVDPPEMETLWI